MSKYKFIHFTKAETKTRTPVYECRNNKSQAVLGLVKWYGPWRQFCFFSDPRVPAVFSDGCLKDIRHFMGGLSNKETWDL